MAQRLFAIAVIACSFSVFRLVQIWIMATLSDDRGTPPYAQHAVLSLLFGILVAMVCAARRRSFAKFAGLMVGTAFALGFAVQVIIAPSQLRSGLPGLLPALWAGASFVPIAFASSVLTVLVTRNVENGEVKDNSRP